jgi:hypothetical protein
LPTQFAIDAYDDDPCNVVVKPSLDPMRPALTSIRSEWNEKLWELLETEELRDTGYNSVKMRKEHRSNLRSIVTLICTLLSQAQRAPWVPQGSSGTKYEDIIE